MSKKLGLAFILCLLFGLASAEPISKITSVVVYQDRALVTRSVFADVKPGINSIVFEGLLPAVLEDSIRASAKGTAEIQINEIEVRRNILEESPEIGIRDLENQMQSLLDEIADLEAQEQVLKTQRAFLESIRVGFSEKASKDLGERSNSATELITMFNFVGESLHKLAGEERQLQIKKREAVKKKGTLDQELARLRSKNIRETKSVEVSFDVRKRGDLELQLSYVIGGARWNPLYDARLSEDGKNLDLHYKAVIYQETGEDWGDVDITLSTARTSVTADPPKLYSWKIQLV